MLENFRYQIPIEVRFADLDALGHLNNAKYLTYAEQIRILYIRDVCERKGGAWEALGMILARTEIDYLLPVAFDDKVLVYCRVSRIGGKSFDMDYLLTRQRGDSDKEIAARIKTVMVAYDYSKDATISVPDDWRERMIAYEPAL